VREYLRPRHDLLKLALLEAPRDPHEIRGKGAEIDAIGLVDARDPGGPQRAVAMQGSKSPPATIRKASASGSSSMLRTLLGRQSSVPLPRSRKASAAPSWGRMASRSGPDASRQSR
jgi:hypothetical protein